MNRSLKVLAGTALMFGVIVAGALPASAHTHAIGSSCADGVTASAASYNTSGKPNTATIYIDGAVVYSNPSFGASFAKTVPNPDKTVQHTWRVVITAWDNPAFNVDQQGVLLDCEKPPVTTTTKPPTTTTTDPGDPGTPATVGTATAVARAVTIAPAFTG